MLWRLVPVALAVGAPACSGKAPGGVANQPLVVGGGCRTSAECHDGQVCIHGRCVDSPAGATAQSAGSSGVAMLGADPDALDFGIQSPAKTRRLVVQLRNIGEVVTTVSRAHIVPPEAPFRVESTGAGPFWIRPLRSREIAVTYAPILVGHHSAVLEIESEAPTVSVNLRGN